jgi:hypothetical protein
MRVCGVQLRLGLFAILFSDHQLGAGDSALLPALLIGLGVTVMVEANDHLQRNIYNLGNLWRRVALPARIRKWSLTSLQQRLVKTGGRLIQHARYYWLLLAKGHLTRRLFAGVLRKIAVLPSPAG